MRYVALLTLFFFSNSVNAQQQPNPPFYHEIVFSSAGELLSWCKSEAQAHFAAAGLKTYQWTGRHHVSGDTLYAEGMLRVDNKDVPVNCRAAKGSRERHAVIEFGKGQ
jgi:hypothetical protein